MASEWKATKRPSAEIAGLRLSPSPSLPSECKLTRMVVVAAFTVPDARMWAQAVLLRAAHGLYARCMDMRPGTGKHVARTASASSAARTGKRERQRHMAELVTRYPIGNQQEFVELLAERGFRVTQATVSRDIASLGLVKVARADRHVYASPQDLAPEGPAASDERLRHALAQYPVMVRRSGLILLLVSIPGTAGAIAQAIDDSTLTEQEGTLAGDNTVLVLFADEARLERWWQRFEALRPVGRDGAKGGAP